VGLYLRGLEIWFRTERAGAPAILLVLLSLTLTLYLAILVLSRGKSQRQGLVLAAATGWAGLLGTLAIVADLPVFGLVLLVPQILLLMGTYRTNAALGRQTGDKRKLHEGAPRWSYLGGLAFLGYLSLVSLPGIISGDEASAVSSLRTVITAEASYAWAYKSGYSPTLIALGPSLVGAQPSSSAAELIPNDLSRPVHSGYRFTYTAAPPDAAGRVLTYEVVAEPLSYGISGRRSFFTDQSGAIRWTDEGRPATAHDPVMGPQKP
jgi:hypothetical protein